MSEIYIVEKDLSYSIVKAAYEVFNGLGPGFDEKIYEEAMIVVLKKYGHVPDQQKRVDVFFKMLISVFINWIW